MLTFTTSEIPHSPTPRMHPAVILACEQRRCPADIEYQPLTCAATIYCHDVTSHREACRRIQPPVPPASCARGRWPRAGHWPCWPACGLHCARRSARCTGTRRTAPSPIGTGANTAIFVVSFLIYLGIITLMVRFAAGQRILPRAIGERLRQHQRNSETSRPAADQQASQPAKTRRTVRAIVTSTVTVLDRWITRGTNRFWKLMLVFFCRLALGADHSAGRIRCGPPLTDP